MIEIESDVKRKRTFAQPRIPGQFFKSGCSVAPAFPKYKQPEGRYRRFKRDDAIVPPMSLMLRKMRLADKKLGNRRYGQGNIAAVFTEAAEKRRSGG